MQFSAPLNVAIGLVFTYFLLALIASGIQEVIAGIFKWRGTYLAKAIDVIVNNDPTATFAWYGWKDMAHALLTPAPGKSAAQLDDQLYPPAPPAAPVPAAPAPVAPVQPAPVQPASPPPPPNPPVAKLDPVMKGVLEGMATHPLLRNAPAALPSYMTPRNFALALLDVLRDGSSLPVFSQVENTVAALPDGDLKTTLSLYIQEAGGDIDKLRANIENWFDGAMDTVTGIYKRFSQYVLVGIGLILSIALNADSFQIFHALWSAPDAAAALAATATEAAGHAPNGDLGAQVKANLAALQSQPLPLGWTNFGGCAAILTAVPGWIVTALAVALGAPFWFSLLQSLTNLRAAGPKPKPSS
jgi:hypothetical protein